MDWLLVPHAFSKKGESHVICYQLVKPFSSFLKQAICFTLTDKCHLTFIYCPYHILLKAGDNDPQKYFLWARKTSSYLREGISASNRQGWVGNVRSGYAGSCKEGAGWWRRNGRAVVMKLWDSSKDGDVRTDEPGQRPLAFVHGCVSPTLLCIPSPQTQI